MNHTLKEELHVFYIDDDEDDRDLFEMAVLDINPRLKYTCLSSASEALEILLKGQDMPDLVIVDLNMPKINGFDFLKAVRLSKFQRKPKVVVLTTSALESERSKAIALGASGFVLKGNDYHDFRLGVENVLSTHLS